MYKLYVTFKLSSYYFQLGRQKAAKEVEKEAQKLEQELYATKGVRIEGSVIKVFPSETSPFLF